MKHLFTCLLGGLLLATPTLAQRVAAPPPADPVRQKLDVLFVNLDRSQVPTGRLLEAAVPLGPVTSFDGLLRDSARAAKNGFHTGCFVLLTGPLV